jgi:hypothetical protein
MRILLVGIVMTLLPSVLAVAWLYWRAQGAEEFASSDARATQLDRDEVRTC